MTLVLSFLSAGLEAKTLARADAVLQHLFPGATLKQMNMILDEEEQKQVGELLGSPLEQAVVTGYVLHDPQGNLIAMSYLDAHRVRTLPETLMVTIDTSSVIVSVDVLAFREPLEYMPKRLWYDQFTRRAFDRKLELNRGVQGVTGATLTGRATVNAVRKLLCIHAVLQARQPDAIEKNGLRNAP
ncbi:MAG: FMN-binding protein [Verrucomicrobia bacterium]|nr:FMN-binding protein [Verrucomicrobiota bacterium]